MKKSANILIVDDDKNFLLSLSEGLKIQDNNLNVFKAENGKQAVKVLKANRIDLLITDLKMPVMDGFKLLAHMSQNHPAIPTIVITAFGTPEIEKKVAAWGAIQYVEKPLDFNDLLERIYEGLKAGSEGYIKGVSLPSFLQLMEVEGKTCTLIIRSEENVGNLYFSKGVLLDARTGKMEGEKAALAIISWDPAEIEIDMKNRKKEKKIQSPLNFILVEAMRLKDERVQAENEKRKRREKETELDISYVEGGDEGVMVLGSTDVLADPLKESESEDLKKNQIKKELVMNVKKLNEAITALRENLGEGLLATDIYSSHDGQSVANWNSVPKACALFNQITNFMVRALKESGFPQLGRFYILDLTDYKMVVVIPLGDYQWGMLVDSKKAPLGLLINIALPNAVSAFEEAITE